MPESAIGNRQSGIASGAVAVFFDEPARLLSRRDVSPDTFELSLRSPRIAQAARPGQFVNVLLPSHGFGCRSFDSAEEWLAAPPRAQPTLIRRPFSIYRAYASDGRATPDTIDLLVKMAGRGTRLLAETPLDTELSVLGPLGNTFALPKPDASAALVAGGCGWASLAMLARALRARGHPVYAFIGAGTVADLPLDTSEGRRPHSFLDELPEVCVTSRELEELGVTVALAAEKGGKLYGGLVTDLLAKFLKRDGAETVHVYACGPWAMLRVAAQLADEFGARCQVSLEERMGCGVGVCNSCVVEVFLADGSIGHKKLCTDGPVLDAAEVNWAQERH